jgi:hypothetical protein
VVAVPGVHDPLWHVSAWVQALPSLQLAPLGLAVHVPTDPARLHDEHWPVQAVAQHTPFAQNPLVQSLFAVQASPNDGSNSAACCRTLAKPDPTVTPPATNTALLASKTAT